MKKIRIAVIDYDRCAYTTTLRDDTAPQSYKRNSSPFYLSEALLDHIKETKCSAFYGCTQRATGSCFQAAFEPYYYNLEYKMYGSDYNPRNLLTTHITDNLATSLALPCLAVSTPDDYVDGTTSSICGTGYNKYIKPYEAELTSTNQRAIDHHDNLELFQKAEIPAQLLEFYHKAELKNLMQVGEKRCKNTQLLSVALHASKQYPNQSIELYFYDDDIDICEFALKIDQLPKNVSLHIYQHKAYYQSIEYIGTVRSLQVTGNSLFTPEVKAKNPGSHLALPLQEIGRGQAR